jgi:hypothetical protein
LHESYSKYIARKGLMDLTKAEYAMYIGTLNAIAKLIEDEPKLTIKRLRHMLIAEIDSVKHNVMENEDGREIHTEDAHKKRRLT